MPGAIMPGGSTGRCARVVLVADWPVADDVAVAGGITRTGVPPGLVTTNTVLENT